MLNLNSEKLKRKKSEDKEKKDLKPNQNRNTLISNIQFTEIECKNKIAEKERVKLISSMIENPKITVNDSSFTHNFQLPSHLRKLSKLYTALISIDKFNKSKEIVTIFHNSKKCIENILNQEVSEKDIEILNNVFPESFDFKKVKINYENREIDSFVIDLKERNSKEMDKRLLKLQVLQPKPLFREESPIKRIKKEIKFNEKSLTILERIKLKEKIRKETFIKNNSIDFTELKNKIKQMFLIENRKSIEKVRVIEQCKLYNGNERIDCICKMFTDEFEVKVINKVEYLIYKVR